MDVVDTESSALELLAASLLRESLSIMLVLLTAFITGLVIILSMFLTSASFGDLLLMLFVSF